MTDKDLRKHSKMMVDGVEQAPSRAMLRAVGFEDGDFAKPQIGICSTWSMVTPCNMHINKLAEDVNKGTDDAGGKGITRTGCPDDIALSDLNAVLAEGLTVRGHGHRACREMQDDGLLHAPLEQFLSGLLGILERNAIFSS